MSAIDRLPQLRFTYGECNRALVRAQYHANSDLSARLAEQSASLQAELLQAHISMGRPLSEWTKLLEFEQLKTQYHKSALAGVSGSSKAWAEFKELSSSVKPRLVEFCLASGVNVDEVDKFVIDVELELLEYLPK